MKKANRIKKLKNAEKSIFSTDDLKDLWDMRANWSSTVIKRFTDSGILTKLARGIYSFGDEVDPFELANTAITPSYISFNSALRYWDIAFQAEKTISSAASYSAEKEIAGYTLKYHKLKDELLYNLEGIKQDEGIGVAEPERAVLDCFYLGILPNLDREEKINKTRLKELAEFYPKTVQDKAKSLIKKL